VEIYLKTLNVTKFFGHRLNSTHFLDAFFIDALVRDSYNLGYQLSVPHRGNHSSRYAEAMHERNRHVAGPNQEFCAHRCDVCHVSFMDRDFLRE
jgi:hypothetical protein